MSYTLEAARTTLKGRLLWLAKKVVREPLEGLVSGKVFHLPYAPAQEDSVVVYDSAGATVGTGAYTLDEEAGSVVFTTAIGAAHSASYTYQAYTDAQLLNFCKEGFDNMQREYPRPLYVVSSGDNYVSSTTSTVTDPVLGTTTFGDSRIQQDFLITCSEYALVKALWQQATMEAIDVREGITGMRVDRSKRPATMLPSLEEIERRVEDAAFVAADEADDTGALFEGGVIPGAKSDDYSNRYDWWTDSEQERGVVA